MTIMGTWGCKTFESDAASDWLYDLEAASDANFLPRPIKAVDGVSFSVGKGAIFGSPGPAGVAAGILPSVEGVHPAARRWPRPLLRLTNYPAAHENSCARSAGLEARLYGRQDARHHP